MNATKKVITFEISKQKKTKIVRVIKTRFFTTHWGEKRRKAIPALIML
jgi:hypothetical protein